MLKRLIRFLAPLMKEKKNRREEEMERGNEESEDDADKILNNETTKNFKIKVKSHNILIKLKTYIKYIDPQKAVKCQNGYKKK